MIVLSCSYLAGRAKFWYDNSSEKTMLEGLADGVPLKKEYLGERYNTKWELPRRIIIEASTLCQLRCPGCVLPRSNPEKIEETCGFGCLSFENFKKLVDDNYFTEIELARFGEMFLNPELADIIKYAYEKNVSLRDYCGANLNYLPDDVAESLVKYKFELLTVSVDAASPESYVKYRIGGDFNQVINNIKKINYYKKLYNSDKPKLVYKFIIFGHNEHEIDKAKQLAKDLDMEILFSGNFLQEFSPVKNPTLVKQKTGIDVKVIPDYNKAELLQENKDVWFCCKDLFEYPQINWDGKVIGCCPIYSNSFGGNAFKDGLLKALNHPKIVYAKNMLTGKAPPIKGIPCTDCDCYRWVKEMKLNVKPTYV